MQLKGFPIYSHTFMCGRVHDKHVCKCMYKQLHVFASIEVSCFLFVSLQVMVFENLFVFRPVSEEVTELLLRLIGDAQMEVGW